MRAWVNHVVAYGVLAAIASSRASAAEPDAQPGGSQWIPSLAITSGVTVQRQSGLQSSIGFDGETNTESLLRPAKYDDDVAASSYVGGALEVMTPALPLPWHPRFFASGEILPTFGPERQVQDGEPSRVRGPELNTVIAVEEDNRHFTTKRGDGPRSQPFAGEDAKGVGMRTRFQVDTWMYGAKAGAAFPFEFRRRQFRLKPSIGWIHYEVKASGLLVHPTCDPRSRCTNTYLQNGTLQAAGFLRETLIKGADRGTFDGVGPGVDLEMDTTRVGPLGAAVFIGVHGYYIPGDRDIHFNVSQSYDDQLSPSAAVDSNTAMWKVRVDPWLWRAGIGMRFHWLGSPK